MKNITTVYTHIFYAYILTIFTTINIVLFQGCEISVGSEQFSGQKIVDEAIKYKDFDKKDWYGRRWLYTSPGPRTSGSCCDPGMGPCACWPFCHSWNPDMKGVAYSYGNKDTPEHFEQKLDSAMKNPNIKNCNWAMYNAFKPGLHRDEYNYYNSNDKWDSIYLWAGIDCNGLVQRCAYAAGFWFNDVYYWGNIGNGEFNYIRGELAIDSIVKYTNPVDISNWSTNVKVGDIVFYEHHIGIIKDVGTSSASAWMIHACGALGWDKRSVREDQNILQSSFGSFVGVRRFFGL